MTQSGHGRLRIAAVQTNRDPLTMQPDIRPTNHPREPIEMEGGTQPTAIDYIRYGYIIRS